DRPRVRRGTACPRRPAQPRRAAARQRPRPRRPARRLRRRCGRGAPPPRRARRARHRGHAPQPLPGLAAAGGLARRQRLARRRPAHPGRAAGMSLINRMLHDLDRRGETPRGVELRAVPPASAPRSRWLAVLLAAPLAIAAAWLLWPRADVVAPQAPLPVSQPVITQPAAAAVVIEEAVETTAPVEHDNEAPAMAEAEPAPAPPAAHAGPAASEPPGRVAVAGQPSAVVIRPHAPSREELRQRARRDGLNAARRGDWVVATRLLQEAIEAAPADDDVREALAVALLRQGRISE